jgi:hypothetical protein
LGSGEPRGRGIGKENAIADGVVAEKFKELVRTEKEKKVPEMDDLEEEDVTKICCGGESSGAFKIPHPNHQQCTAAAMG